MIHKTNARKRVVSDGRHNTSSHSFGQRTFAIPRAFQGFLQAIDH
jgi:hypothetical protein